LPIRGAVLALTASAAALLVTPAAASAGNLIVTGHDTDHHCGAAETSRPGQCHFVRVGIDFARRGAPDPAKPVLVLTKGDNEAANAIDKAFGAGAVPYVVVTPGSGQFAATPIDTANFSAIYVASDRTCGGCDLNDFDTTPDSDAINARAGDIQRFFNAGGGLFVNAGAAHGDGDANSGRDTYYDFLPLPVGATAVAPPFTLTAAGRELGLEDSRNGIGANDDINCCETHNAFRRPAAGSALKVAETDSSGNAVTLYTSGAIADGRFVAPGATDEPQQVRPGQIGLPPARRCVDTRRFSFRLRNPRGRRAVRVEVFVNGKRKKVFRGSALRRIAIKRLPRRRFVVRIVVTQDDGARRATKRTYKGCKKGRVRRG
jgi:hypothetical protein